MLNNKGDFEGFDLIIGNPPYVEYSKVRETYKVKDYATEKCGNLYAFVMERSLKIANQNSFVGFIIPISDDVEIISKSFDNLKPKFQPTIVDKLNFDLDGFESIIKYANLGTQFIVALNSIIGERYILHCLGEARYLHYKGRHDDDLEYKTWGILKLNNNLGNIIVRKETISDKVSEIFRKTEIDFPDDYEFSNNFYVVADDKIKTITWLTNTVRKAIKEITLAEFAILIKGNTLLIGTGNQIDIETPYILAQFLTKLK